MNHHDSVQHLKSQEYELAVQSLKLIEEFDKTKHKLDLAVVGLKNARSALDEFLPWDAEAIQKIGELLFKLTGIEET